MHLLIVQQHGSEGYSFGLRGNSHGIDPMVKQGVDLKDLWCLESELLFGEEVSNFFLDRNILDHCPILLKMVTIDWGPKPFRTLDCWFENKDFKGFVEEDWRQGVVHGR